MDTFGDHVVACHGRRDAISRHDRIRNHIASACSDNLSPVIEKRNLIAENKTPRRHLSAFLEIWPIFCSRFNRDFCNRTLFLMRQRSLAMQLKPLKIENMLNTKIAVLNKEFCSSLWQPKFWVSVEDSEENLNALAVVS